MNRTGNISLVIIKNVEIVMMMMIIIIIIIIVI